MQSLHRGTLAAGTDAFEIGFAAAIRASQPAVVCSALRVIRRDLLGHAYEGAAMAYALCDLLAPRWHSHWSRFVEATAYRHVQFGLIGAGRAIARQRYEYIPDFVRRRAGFFQPVTIDGYGYETTLLQYSGGVKAVNVPEALSKDTPAFDRGVGRALIVLSDGDAQKLVKLMEAFDDQRRSDLWVGVGMAITVFHISNERTIRGLLDLSGASRDCLAQGIALGSLMQRGIGGHLPDVDAACTIVWANSMDGTVALVAEELAACVSTPSDLRFEAWQRKIRAAARRYVA